MLYRGTAALEVWARRSVSGVVEVTNMGEDWRDGRAFLALLHHHRPDLVDMEGVVAGNTRHNCQRAFSIAERLGAPALLEVQDMVEAPQLDRLSLLTYLSSLYHCLSEEASDRKISEDSGVSVEEESICSSCSSSSGYASPDKEEREERQEKVVRRAGGEGRREGRRLVRSMYEVGEGETAFSLALRKFSSLAQSQSQLEEAGREGGRGREGWGRTVTLHSQTRGLRTETTFQVTRQGQL